MRNLLHEAHSALAVAIDAQQNIATRRQLNEAGIDDMAIARRVRQGHWRRLLPGTYLLGNGELSAEQRLIAASVYAGDEAQITGAAALAWYGFRYAPAPSGVHVLVPHERRRRSSSFVTIQRTLVLDQAARPCEQYRICSPARAAVDFCRQTTDLRLTRAVIAEAVQRNFTTIHAIEEEVRRAARSRTAIVRQALREILDGARSAPEAQLRTLLETSKILPRVLWNPSLRTVDGIVLPTPDAYIPEAALALEVDSREYHADPDGWARTLHRHNTLSQYGVVILHFRPSEIDSHPRRVLSLTERTYLSRMASPPSAVARIMVTPTASRC